MTIRDAITRRLAALGWSQADLARATGIPRQNLSPILRGLRPLKVQHLLVLDCVLNLNLDYSRCVWEEGTADAV